MREVIFVFTRVMYQAVIEVKITIAATEKTVIKSDQKNASGKPVFLIPLI